MAESNSQGSSFTFIRNFNTAARLIQRHCLLLCSLLFPVSIVWFSLFQNFSAEGFYSSGLRSLFISSTYIQSLDGCTEFPWLWYFLSNCYFPIYYFNMTHLPWVSLINNCPQHLPRRPNKHLKSLCCQEPDFLHWYVLPCLGFSVLPLWHYHSSYLG